jgi:predicted polyphosphate/ATP-dependent NAD kinase
MPTVGIIANPASGQDIRRLVAQATVFDNGRKVQMLRQLLHGLEAVGVRRILIMPDSHGLGRRALAGLRSDLTVEFLPIPLYGEERDSTEAARVLQEMGAGCIVTLGGDGTVRAVAKGCGPVPLVSISTGTNNVVPNMVESTVAGLAAGLVATGRVAVEPVSSPSKRLEIYVGDALADIALVDLVLSHERFIASRALWQVDQLQRIFLAVAEPGSIGISAIGSGLRPVSTTEDFGLDIEVGNESSAVLAPIAPGLICAVGIRACRVLTVGSEVLLGQPAGTIALDGERSLELFGREPVVVRLSRDGPRLVDIRACLRQATANGFFMNHHLSG